MKNAEKWEEEAAMVKKLEVGGVSVVSGKHYGSIDGEKSWIRMLFAVQVDVMKEALGRMEKVLKGM